MLDFAVDLWRSRKLVAEMHIHARLGSGEDPVKPLLQRDSTPGNERENENSGSGAGSFGLIRNGRRRGELGAEEGDKLKQQL
jgi:hypothetical protein